MPDEKKKVYPLLEHMSTEQLEDLIRQSTTMPNGEGPDIDLICEIMEVIQKREESVPEAEGADVSAAWQDFQENYQGKSEFFESGFLQELESNHPEPDSKGQRPKKKQRRFMRSLIAAAAILVLLCGAASAFGFNIFQAVANWTQETFQFGAFGEENNVDPFAALRDAVLHMTNIAVVPNWAPDDTVQNGDVAQSEQISGTRIQSTYTTEQGEFTIRVFIYQEVPSSDTGVYQKDGNPVVSYEAGGITHFLMQNNDSCVATWLNGNVECLIQGDLTIGDLEQMIDSIY